MKRSWRAAEKLAKAVYIEWVTYEDQLGDLGELDELDEVIGLDHVDDLEGLYANEDNRERQRSIQGPYCHRYCD